MCVSRLSNHIMSHILDLHEHVASVKSGYDAEVTCHLIEVARKPAHS